MEYCSRCVFPAVAATPLTFDDKGVCSGCRASDLKKMIDWEKREKLFTRLIDGYRSKDNYDCLLPVSGGKDSYFAAHIAKKYGLRALMVTYHGNNYLDVGERNLNRMKDEFGFDHIILRPSTDVLIRLNRLGFKITGDMNWHCHAGIFTYPMQIAVVQYPSGILGDHGFTEQGGMYYIMTFLRPAKDRYEHALHGYDWFDFINKEGMKKDIQYLVYPVTSKYSTQARVSF